MSSEQAKIERIQSIRKKEKAAVNGFFYSLHRTSGDTLQWVCEKRGTCKARLHTIHDIVVMPSSSDDINTSHTHGPDQARIEMVKTYAKVKEQAAESEMSTRSIFSTGIQTLHPSSIVKLPQFSSVKRTIRNHKNSFDKVFQTPTCAADVEIPPTFKVTISNEPFLLYDSGLGDHNRILIFSTPKMLSLLRDCSSWYADGTFKIVPKHIFQLYTIHAERDGFVIPCVYSLMTDKSESSYNTLLNKLMEQEPSLNPFTVMLDFEKAAINAFEENFIAVISCCFFHLSQNIYRKIQSIGLATKYQDDKEFALKMKMLPSLAFVPESEVVNCFNLLMQDFPESAHEVAIYFENNYIGKKLADQTRRIPPYPIRIWNMHERISAKMAKTNNSVEGWHNAINSSISSLHPSFLKFLKFLHREQALQEARIAKWEAGNVEVKSKKSITRSEQLLHLVSDYDNRDPIAFLRGVSYNFDF